MNRARRVLISTTVAGLFVVGTAIGARAILVYYSAAGNHELADVNRGEANAFLTRADALVQKAQRAVSQSPDAPDSYNLLAAAFMRKARESGDFSFNSRAEAALNRSFELDHENYDATKLQAKLLLTYHRFSQALEVAQRAQSLRPDDHDVYGAITDAQVELGNYPAAISAAQKMVDLRPDSSSYARVSYLRSLHGDIEGAVLAMTVAVKAANPADPEEIAWCRVHLGIELMNAGQPAQAEQEYDKALSIFPAYPLALAAKARARIRSGNLNQALELYKRAQELVPLPDTAAALGDLYTKLGKADEAKREYDLVEFIERNSAASGTYSRQLALMWADHDVNLDQALAMALKERSQRQDIFTCDALAWVLFKTNRLNEAKSEIAQALRLATHDAQIYYHAGMIYQALGDRRKAAKYLESALKFNPTFDLLEAEKARRTLEGINRGNLSCGAATELSQGRDFARH
jgi:tetratricopeptide (TPR) repeat protein